MNEQLKAGLITEQQAQTSRFKNIITRSVGFEVRRRCDVIVVETRPGDAVLLCSDGLSGLLSDKEINDIVNENFLRRAPEMLVNSLMTGAVMTISPSFLTIFRTVLSLLGTTPLTTSRGRHWWCRFQRWHLKPHEPG